MKKDAKPESFVVLNDATEVSTEAEHGTDAIVIEGPYNRIKFFFDPKVKDSRTLMEKIIHELESALQESDSETDL